MKRLSLLLVLFIVGQCLQAQIAPNFTVTDTEGQVHRLYEDYLDQGSVVVVKMFFISCPLCKPFNEPFQQMYEDFGEGEDSVQFLLLTTREWDSNIEVAEYKTEYGLSFPASGFDGGGYDATEPYRDGSFGMFFGSPTFLVIEPNRTVHFNLEGGGVDATMDNVRNKIDEVKGSGGEMAVGTQVDVDLTDYKGGTLPEYVLRLQSSVNPDTGYVVPVSFLYPSVDYPELIEPELVVEIDSFTKTGITTIDLVVIQRHLLELLELDPIAVVAADANGSGNVSAADLLNMRKFILSLNDNLGVGKTFDAVDSRCLDNEDLCKKGVAIDTTLSQQKIDFTVIKYGDVK